MTGPRTQCRRKKPVPKRKLTPDSIADFIRTAAAGYRSNQELVAQFGMDYRREARLFNQRGGAQISHTHIARGVDHWIIVDPD